MLGSVVDIGAVDCLFACTITYFRGDRMDKRGCLYFDVPDVCQASGTNVDDRLVLYRKLRRRPLIDSIRQQRDKATLKLGADFQGSALCL